MSVGWQYAKQPLVPGMLRGRLVCWGDVGGHVGLDLGGVLPLVGPAVVSLGDLLHHLFQVHLGPIHRAGKCYLKGVRISSHGHLLQ